MRKLLNDFKEFAVGGNLIEIAVGLVMALAFAALINVFVAALIMPIVAGIFGQPDFSSLWKLGVGEATMEFGTFVTALIQFLSIAFAVYFFVVRPYKAYTDRQAVAEEEVAGPSEIDLLTDIRDALAR